MSSSKGRPVIHKSQQKESHALPNLIVIGAMKCATTSLHYYLGLHPEISMSQEKELNFFIREGNWHRGIEWYRSNFAGEAKICGESSPNYANYPFSRGVPERIYSCIPEAKLIYVVRNPIDRIVSHYVHQYAADREDRTLSDALANLDGNPHVCRSKYAMQLEQYLDYFHQSNILIIAQEDLQNRREETLRKVFRFLEVDESFYCQEFLTVKHKSMGKRRNLLTPSSWKRMPEMNALGLLPPLTRQRLEQLVYLSVSHKVEQPVLDERLRERLVDSLEDDMNRFREFTGYGFPPWCP